MIARGLDPALSRELGSRIVRTTSRLATLIDELLAFSRVHAEPTGPTRSDAAEVLKVVLREMADRMQKLNADVQLSVTPTPVSCSPSLLASVFQNLLENALKYGHRGDAPPHIKVVVQPAGANGRISVADQGIGMTEDTKRRAFEPFFQGQTGTDGSGLGLATVRRIVALHGGSISIESAAMVGTTFEVLLPAAGVA
jgi:signal transduction histidine kinase